MTARDKSYQLCIVELSNQFWHISVQIQLYKHQEDSGTMSVTLPWLFYGYQITR